MREVSELIFLPISCDMYCYIITLHLCVFVNIYHWLNWWYYLHIAQVYSSFDKNVISKRLISREFVHLQQYLVIHITSRLYLLSPQCQIVWWVGNANCYQNDFLFQNWSENLSNKIMLSLHHQTKHSQSVSFVGNSTPQFIQCYITLIVY